MQRAERNVGGLFAGMLLTIIAGHAAAQQPPHPQPRPVLPHQAQQTPRPAAPQQPQQAAQPSGEPQRTTASFGDWVVQCETLAGPPAQKVCDMSQLAQTTVQGRTTPFSRVAVAHPVKAQPVKFIVQVPVNVTFGTDVRIMTAESDPGIAAPFARCTPNGCFAEFDLKDDILKKFRAASGAGKLSFADSGGHEISVPLSFRGFSQAFEALAKE